ncbi:ankyrin repeat domain-containing protein [Campylobacter sp. CS_NA1]|uniref:ankyrin repeat domain-containing protein n=1 Tax=Campylobacter sp. CS_NA1 TaxID=2984139 RepID=UPI0022E9D49F|nr:ankyrin repeat domain-containing protein [Campylobacter sp. CS_NA1]MDA3081709.1 ankyrin repeat domain-containing protein [Campylobacter sp. CS_NA1]
MAVILRIVELDKKKSHFVVTGDTNVSQVKGLSKYVTQEEIDGFALRHWNIANESDHYDENETQKSLRHLLEARQTDKVLEFLKDNNLSADTKLQANTTPLMYSAFYNDENTTKELIKLGANIRAKDSYKFSPMAYAIGNNSIETVKILLENGVKFDEVEKVQTYAKKDNFLNGIDFIEIDDNNKTIIHIKRQHITKPIQNEDEYHVFPAVMFEHIVRQNLFDLAKLILENGYKPYTYNYTNSDGGIEVSNVFEEIVSADEVIEHGKFKQNRKNEKFNLETDFEFYADELKFDLSLYRNLRYDNYEPMLNLLLEHNISGQPSEQIMKDWYDRCLYRYEDAIREKVYYLGDMRQGIDKYAEELAIYEYAKKNKLTAKKVQKKLDKEHSSKLPKNYIKDILKKDNIIVEKSMKPTPFIIKLLDEEIDRYAKYCGDKDLDFERDLVNWNDEIFKRHDQYQALAKWENKPERKTANFKDIKDFIGFLSEFYKPDRDIGLAIIKDTNLTYNEYIGKIVDKHAQTLTEKIKFGNKSKQELIELKHWFYN